MADEKKQADRILKEHRNCLQVLAELEGCLDRFPDAVRDKELLTRLRALDGALRPHFKAEEKGIFSELPIDQPHLAPRLQKLKEEHGTMLESLREATQEAEQTDDQSQGLLKLKARVQLLAVTLRRHEAEENELVTEAHWNTFGISD